MHRPVPRLPAYPQVDDPLPLLRLALAWKDEDYDRAVSLRSVGLPPLATVHTLPFLFGVSHSFVNLMRRRPERFYRTFEIPKASGEPRVIVAPRVALKIIQRWLHEQVLVSADSNGLGTGFRPGTSIFKNGQVHFGAKNLMQTDLKDFYGSVKRDSVIEVFERLGFSRLVAMQLAELTTLNGSLPQGAPSSPLLSNLVVSTMDERLAELAISMEAGYSRYADDITFSSSSHKFVEDDLDAVRAVVGESGFDINSKKTRLVGGGYRHVITGVSAETRLQFPRSKRRAWRALFNRAQFNPEQYVGQRARLLGIAAAVSAYDSDLAAKYRSVALKVPNEHQNG